MLGYGADDRNSTSGSSRTFSPGHHIQVDARAKPVSYPVGIFSRGQNEEPSSWLLNRRLVQSLKCVEVYLHAPVVWSLDTEMPFIFIVISPTQTVCTDRTEKELRSVTIQPNS
jgi:hypothetical protein